MFEFGICTLADLKAAVVTETAPRRNCFIGLYPEVIRLKDDSGSRMSEAVLRNFAIHTGAFKRTSCKRTVEFDHQVLKALHCDLATKTTHVVQDLGVSDARNSCDFFATYTTIIGTSPEFFATDLCFTVFSIHRRHARTYVVIDAQGRVIQVMFPPFVFPAKVGLRYFLRLPINVLLRSALVNTSASKSLRLYRRNDPSIEKDTISLVCSEAQRLASTTRNFHLEQHNAFDRPLRSYSTVRALNLFNRSYFSSRQIRRALSNVLESLMEGGAFIIGSNGDSGSTVDGAAYLKRQRGFYRVFTSGKGCAIDSLILNAHIPQP